LLLIVIV